MAKYCFTKARSGYQVGQAVEQADLKEGVFKTLVKFGVLVPQKKYKSLVARQSKELQEKLESAASKIKPNTKRLKSGELAPRVVESPEDESVDDSTLDIAENEPASVATGDTGGSEVSPETVA